MPKMKGIGAIKKLQAEFPPATVSKSPRRKRPDNKPVMLELPKETIRSLKMKAASEDKTLRAVVLEAIAAAGHPVDLNELGDMRKRD